MSSPLPLSHAESQPPLLSESPQPHAHTHKDDGDAAEAVSAAANAPAEAAAASSSSAPSSSVLVTDESTKSCSSCLEDRPLSSYSSAQLKKKGKRVCNGCVAKKEAAATAQQEAERKEARRIAFEARLNATAPLECSSCARKVTRVASCPRCTVGCCSAACFMAHHCDVYVEARRTMPTTRVAEEDRLTPDEVMPAWNEIMTHLRQMAPTRRSSARAVATVNNCFASLDSEVHPFMLETDWSSVCTLYSPHITCPWWRPSCFDRLGCRCSIATRIHVLSRLLLRVSEVSTIIVKACCMAAAPEFVLRDLASGIVSIRIVEATSPCLMPNRLVHKLTTLLLWLVRAMDPAWLAKTFDTPADVSSDEFGMLPLTSSTERPDDPVEFIDCDYLLAYMQHVDPVTDQRTLVPLTGMGYLPLSSSTFCLLENHLGSRILSMVARSGLLVRERGLYTTRKTTDGIRKLSAVTGWTGRLSDSFLASPVSVDYFEDDQLLDKLKTDGEKWPAEEKDNFEKAVREELDARKRPGYFHLVPAIKQLVGPTVWAAHTKDVLFIATPQFGLESELVELALLESLAEEAAEAACAIDLSDDAGHPAQLLIAHIEDECGASIAEVIARQKSRVEWMMEAQAEQLRIHAEAVERANNRGKLAAADSSSVDTAAAPSSFSSALAPDSAASSSSSSSSSAASAVVPLSLCGSSSPAVLSAPAASWTSSKELQSVAALCEAGRVKYKTITSAALRFLRSLRPERVNRSGGSHTVFHFASGPPVTLVTPHGGDGTVSKHAVTRLYQTMHAAAMQQMEGPAIRASITEAE